MGVQCHVSASSEDVSHYAGDPVHCGVNCFLNRKVENVKRVMGDDFEHWRYEVRCRCCGDRYEYVAGRRVDCLWNDFYNHVLGLFKYGFSLTHCEICDKFTAQDLISIDMEPRETNGGG